MVAFPRVNIRAFAWFRSLQLGRIARRLPAVPLAVALAAGIASGASLLPARPLVVVACWGVALSFCVVWWWLTRRRFPHAAAITLWLVVAAAGAGWGLAAMVSLLQPTLPGGLTISQFPWRWRLWSQRRRGPFRGCSEIPTLGSLCGQPPSRRCGFSGFVRGCGGWRSRGRLW